MLSSNAYTDDTCMGYNYQSEKEETNALNLRQIHEKLFNPKGVFRLAPSGTCESQDVSTGRRPNIQTTIINEEKFYKTANELAKIYKKCKDDGIQTSIPTNLNAYSADGVCFYSDPFNIPLMMDGSVYKLLQPLTKNSGLYARECSYCSTQSVIYYSSKETLPTKLVGIMQVKGVYQYNSNYGLQTVPKVVRIAKYRDSEMVKYDK